MTREDNLVRKIDRKAARANRAERLTPEYLTVIEAVAALSSAHGPGVAWALCCRLAKVHHVIHLRSGREAADGAWAALTKGRAA